LTTSAIGLLLVAADLNMDDTLVSIIVLGALTVGTVDAAHARKLGWHDIIVHRSAAGSRRYVAESKKYVRPIIIVGQAAVGCRHREGGGKLEFFEESLCSVADSHFEHPARKLGVSMECQLCPAFKWPPLCSRIVILGGVISTGTQPEVVLLVASVASSC
jgi:hypothetical protein